MTAATTTPRATDPRRLVTTCSLRLLFDAAVGSDPFGLCESDDGDWWTICPRCGYRDCNGGSARPIDEWRFRCHRCRRTMTRILVERIVLEDADALGRFCELLSGGAT